MSLFICPVCKKILKKKNNCYKCEKNHTFDISKDGYVNLLLPNSKNSSLPGDNKLMVNSRREFLEKGYYSILSENINNTLYKHLDKSIYNIILDTGCGEGYYTCALNQFLEGKEISFDVYGIDISKFALAKAGRRNKDIEFAVASIFDIPVNNKSCNAVLNIFAPFNKEEYKRIIKKGGILMLVIPGENHLFELKSAIYENPYKNQHKNYDLEGFDFEEKVTAEKIIHLDSPNDIENLFKMTPYYYKTSKSDQEKIKSLKELDTLIQFEILLYKKI